MKNILQSGGHLEYIILRSCVKLSISEMKLRVLNIDVLLIHVQGSITDGRRLILPYRHFVLFRGGHLEIHPKWRVGPKISSVYILILNKGDPMNNIILLLEGP